MSLNSRTLIVRADADSRIGVGHVMRTLALAQCWNERFGDSLYLVGPLTPEPIQARVRAEGCEVEVLDSGDLLEDARRVVDVASQRHAFAIVIDGYHFDEAYLGSLKSANWKTLVFDDDIRLDKFDCDFVLNQNLGAAAEPYAGRTESAHLLLGCQYSLLRKEFIQHPQLAKPLKPVAENLLITMGGADPMNATMMALQAALHVKSLSRIRLIVGSANPNRTELEQLAKQNDRIETIVNSAQMAEHYRWADLAVCAGGSSNWEMSYFGVPRLVVVQAVNQAAIARNLHQRGAACFVGECESIDQAVLQNQLSELATNVEQRKQMSQRSQLLVDGQGALRAAKRLVGDEG